MVSALLLIALPLAAAFLLGLISNRHIAYALTLAAMAAGAAVSGWWVWQLGWAGAAPVDILTAGTAPPFAINLRMGLAESVLALTITLTGLLAAIYLKDTLLAIGQRAMAVVMIAVMAYCGIVLTRDLFNLFVFFELAAIATAGLILLSDDALALGAGFKYLVVSQIISALLLVGIIFAYHGTGNLNIDGMAAVTMGRVGGSLAIAFFLIFIAIVAELKPFPANGWALDIYESAHPAFSALFSAAAGTATLYAADKLLAIGGPAFLPMTTGIGVLTFLAGNILALPQHNDRRLLGYSSIAQIGLVLAIVGQRDILGSAYWFVAFGILVSHAIAKAGLYFLSGMVVERDLTAWAALRARPPLIFAFATFIALLTGLPPFPSFYAKWELAHALAANGRLALLAVILFGALVEAAYLFRWFGYAIKRAVPEQKLACAPAKGLPTLVVLIAGWALAWLWGRFSGQTNLLMGLPLLFALAFLLTDRLPAWINNTLAIAGLVAWFALTWQAYDPLRMIFAVIMLLGGAVVLLASYHVHGKRPGFYPSAMLMYAGMAQLLLAGNSFDFFAAWEVLTVGSYFLILRGKDSEPHALSYIVFSLGGAFLILAGFALAANGAPVMPLGGLASVPAAVAPWVFVLLAIGFMTKTAAIGLHIWLPGAHAEAETDVSPMVSGILLKAGLYGLVVVLLTMGRQRLGGIDLTHVLLWIAALTALLGNLMAIFQEDSKRLLAYSSIGQMGYAQFGLAMMNHLGWLMALMFVINHYVYKSMLFLAVGGVAKRTGTREMYRMGGLITLMPLSFISVLIGIIAMSGVPPLSGFGGRWIFYNALLTSDYRLPMILVFFSGPIAFLYLFRLIHTIFLGQLKDEHRRVKEAPFWLMVPQMIYVVILIVVAVVPGMALRRVDEYMTRLLPANGLTWDGFRITSDYGYWDPMAIMIIVAVIFATLFLWLLFLNRKAQWVKQFNIAYSAERPFRPETTHFAWNFFAPYRKALGFLVQPLATAFWDTVTGSLHAGADFARKLYTGNGQTYALQFLGFVLAAYLLSLGV